MIGQGRVLVVLGPEAPVDREAIGGFCERSAGSPPPGFRRAWRSTHRLLAIRPERSWGLRKGGDDTVDPAADARAAAIVGNPDECLCSIERAQRQIAPDHLILLMGFRGTSDTDTETSLNLAGERVLPQARH